MITEQVWIVDDDSSIRWVLEKAFANENISCAAFESAENLLIALDPVSYTHLTLPTTPYV